MAATIHTVTNKKKQTLAERKKQIYGPNPSRLSKAAKTAADKRFATVKANFTKIAAAANAAQKASDEADANRGKVTPDATQPTFVGGKLQGTLAGAQDPVKTGIDPAIQIGYEDLENTFKKYGLGDIWETTLKGLATTYAGVLSADQMLQLEDVKKTDAYEQRFGKTIKAYHDNPKNKGKIINAGEVYQLEQVYGAAMAQAGLPKGFYDNPVEDFSKWIAGGVNVNEVQGRVASAKKAYEIVQTNNPEALKALRDWYGIDGADIVASFLDSDYSAELEKKANAAVIAGQGGGLNISQATAEEAGAKYSDPSQTEAAMHNAREQKHAANRLGITDDDLAKVALSTSGYGDALDKTRKLASQERARYGGTSAATSGSLTQKRDAI